MVRRSIALILAAALALSLSPAALAGHGIKIETEGLDKYTSVGLDLEIGLPGVPLRPFAEVLGWWSQADTQPNHVQAGLGARYYIAAASSGLFAEAKLRYVSTFAEDAEPGTALLAGLGYRISPGIGSLDLFAVTTLSEHDLLPRYIFGARIGF